MVASYNGWTASSSPDAINIIKTQIGEKAYVYVAAKAAPVLGYAGRYWDNFIENIDGGVWDEWGYAYREVRGGGSLSNHASGSAIDINATRYPRGRANMDSKTKAQVRAMVMKINAAAGTTVIKWGGEWFGEYTDQMHLEIAEGASADEVRWARKVLDGLPPVDPEFIRSAWEHPLRHPIHVGRVQKRLVSMGFLKRGGFTPGRLGGATKKAIMRWQKYHGYEQGKPNRFQLAHMSHRTFRVTT
jgi:hypothetical protein